MWPNCKYLCWFCSLLWLSSGGVVSGHDEETFNCTQTFVDADWNLFACCKAKLPLESESCVEQLQEVNRLTQTCFVDCMYHEKGLYNGTEFNRTATAELLTKMPEPMAELYSNAYEWCLALGTAELLKRFGLLSHGEHNSNEDEDCDEAPLYLDKCVRLHASSHCALAEQQATGTGCQRKAKWMKACLLS